MKVALVQVNPIVGDIAGNAARVRDQVEMAKQKGADVAVATELALTGYPPRDLLEDPTFIDANRRALDNLAKEVDIPTVVGFVDAGAGFPRLYNAAAVLEGGRVASIHHKTLLPTYDVFDEARYFAPAESRALAKIQGVPVGVTICEDNWNDSDFWPRQRYDIDPVAELAAAGARLFVTISASPFSWGKRLLRRRLWSAQAKKYGLPLIAVNQVGGNDDLIFDGGSMGFDKRGDVCARAAEFKEDLIVCEVDIDAGTVKGSTMAPHADDEVGELRAVIDGLVLGTRDYAHKVGFQKAVIGLSGGIDSAVTAVLAVLALGADNVWGVAMPSRHSSEHSLKDAEALAKNLGIRFDVIGIDKPFSSFLEVLAPQFRDTAENVAEENIQARARGVILMALSNKFGHLVLSTGNKSELAVGFCTLYGDMSGGLAILSDVPKTDVYRIANELNRRFNKEVIPKSSIEKAPSAELRPNQIDQDTLPPYPVLDEILDLMIEQNASRDDLIARGFDAKLIDDVRDRFLKSEYKRYQAAPGLKVTDKAFGPGRRMPLAVRYRLR
jgi:NAD+ synthetase